MIPQEIETESFRIIDSEAGDHGYGAEAWQVVRRVIHTSADFEWQRMIRLHPAAIDAGVAAIGRGCAIVTDTNMARVGIRQRDLDRFGGTVNCFMADPRVVETARREGITRAKAAVDVAADTIDGGIYVVGNAPTALLRLIDLMGQGRVRPALVVGLPVGFVNAAESKVLLMEQRTVPYITNVGRKGGSNVAAAVVNALILLAGQENQQP